MPSKLLILMQGPPGSGKTTTAEELRKTFGGVRISADDYFMDNGQYMFDRAQLPDAHAHCRALAEQWMLVEVPLLILDNTNLHRGQVAWYKDRALLYGYTVAVIRCHGRYPNVHKVPSEVVEKMRNKMEDLLG
jgi:predicted kinase